MIWDKVHAIIWKIEGFSDTERTKIVQINITTYADTKPQMDRWRVDVKFENGDCLSTINYEHACWFINREVGD